LIGNLIGITLG